MRLSAAGCGTQVYTRRGTTAQIAALTMILFGGWVVYLSERKSGTGPKLTDDLVLAEWANLWVSILNEPPERRSA